MNLEGSWPVYIGSQIVGQCVFRPQGLYWVVSCTIREGWEGVSRLALFHGGEAVNLGIPVPRGVVLSLERKIPQKTLPVEGDFYLELLPAEAPLLSQRGEKTQEQPGSEEPPVTERVPEEAAPEEPLMTEEIPQEEASEEPLLPEGMPVETIPGESPGKEEAPIETAPEEVPVSEEEPKEGILEEPSVVEGTPEEVGLDEPTAIEGMPEEMTLEEPPVIEEVPPDDPGEQGGQTEEAAPEDILFYPGDRLPPLKNWRDFRVTPREDGGFILSQRGGENFSENPE